MAKPVPVPVPTYSKEFLDAINAALGTCAVSSQPIVLLYQRKGKLDIRVKVDATPPIPGVTLLVFQEAT